MPDHKKLTKQHALRRPLPASGGPVGDSKRIEGVGSGAYKGTILCRWEWNGVAERSRTAIRTRKTRLS